MSLWSFEFMQLWQRQYVAPQFNAFRSLLSVAQWLSWPLAGAVFGLLSGLAAWDQVRAQLVWAAVLASCLSMPYMFIEGSPLIFPFLPFLVGPFVAGVWLSHWLLGFLLSSVRSLPH
jgi:hypothetical protein